MRELPEGTKENNNHPYKGSLIFPLGKLMIYLFTKNNQKKCEWPDLRPTLEQAAAFISSALSAQPPPDLSATLHLSFKAAAADKVEE